MGQQKAEKVSDTNEKQLEKYFATNLVNWKLVSIMTAYKMNI